MASPKQSAAKHDIAAIGASAGGLHALLELVSAFPPGFPAAILIVQHLDPRSESHMAEIVARAALIPVVQAADGDVVEAGKIYIAPPDRHMLLEQDRIRLTTTELVHFVRPSVDLLLESVAAARNERAIGVILTGGGTDGALGIRAIKERGGVTIAQDPSTAGTGGMPSAAIATGAVDMVLPLAEIGKRIFDLVTGNYPKV